MSKYGDILKESQVHVGTNEIAKAERILVKSDRKERIRFSWWPNNNYVPQALVLQEDEWIRLFDKAVKEDIFTQDFIKKMTKIFSNVIE